MIFTMYRNVQYYFSSSSSSSIAPVMISYTGTYQYRKDDPTDIYSVSVLIKKIFKSIILWNPMT